VAQYLMLKANPGMSGFAAAFSAPMTITASATVFSIYTSQQVFNGQVIIKISTDGKILIVGKLNFAANKLSISGRLYADLSNVASGKVTVLFLADVPDQIQLLTIYGKLQMGFRNSSGEEVTFDVALPSASAAGSTAPTVTIVDPAPTGGTVDVNTVGAQHTIDLVFTPAPGANLDYASILDDGAEFTLSGPGVTAGTITGKPTPVVALSLDTGILLVTLNYKASDNTIWRYGPSREQLKLETASPSYSGLSDQAFIDAVKALPSDSAHQYSGRVDYRIDIVTTSTGAHVRAVTVLAVEVVATASDVTGTPTEQSLMIAAISPASTAASREPNKYQATRVTSPPVAADPISRPSVARIRPPSNSTGMIRNGLSGSMLNDPGLCQCGGSGAGSCSPSIIRIIRLTPAVMPPAKSPALNFGVMSSSIMRLVVASVRLPSRPYPTSIRR